MSEQAMIDMVQAVSNDVGLDDQVLAAGEFEPRGHSGGAFLGGMLGSEAGSVFGGVGDAVGTAAGFVGGQRVADTESGLPASMIIGVDTMACGFAGRRSRLTSGLLFRLLRSGLTATVHQRVNVRVVELVDGSTGSRLELEGNHLPVTHSKDVIELLR